MDQCCDFLSSFNDSVVRLTRRRGGNLHKMGGQHLSVLFNETCMNIFTKIKYRYLEIINIYNLLIRIVNM